MLAARRAPWSKSFPIAFVIALTLVLLGLTAAQTAGADTTAHRSASKPAADCQPFSGSPCLLPFPDNRFTRRDRSTPTGVRVRLPANAMPVNVKGRRVGVGEYDRADGFSPGSALIIHIPGLDNAAAFAKTGSVPLTNMARSFAKSQPVVVIDEQTHARQLIWTELDANARGAQNTDLLIHPGKNFTEGHTYVVGLRNLRTASGAPITAPRWFGRLRDGRGLPADERSQRARYRRIFSVLRAAAISRSNLYEAWDFTVASRQSLTGRMLAIRNNAFARLGDHNLADGKVQGRAPAFAVSSADSSICRVHACAGYVRGAVLPRDLRSDGDDRLSLQLAQAGRAADADSWQRRDRGVRMHDSERRNRRTSCPHLALRARPPRQSRRGRGGQRPGDGARARLRILRDRLVGPCRRRHPI